MVIKKSKTAKFYSDVKKGIHSVTAMNSKVCLSALAIVLLFIVVLERNCKRTGSTWKKHKDNPLLGGGELGTIFDVAVIKDNTTYSMYLSWRLKDAIGVSFSHDGIEWSQPSVIFEGKQDSTWEQIVNRPVVLRKNNVWHMWYTGQVPLDQKSSIGYANSTDGFHFKRVILEPVLIADLPWEKQSVMCPHVVWDEDYGIYKMWYSGGDYIEPNAIGYATSMDGLKWTKNSKNPIMTGESGAKWEHDRVTGCQVLKIADIWYMFYIGFQNQQSAQIGLARSIDGINWERYNRNPIIKPSRWGWDCDSTYKPFAHYDGSKWLLWYNGRRGTIEQIGVASYPDAVIWK